MEPKLVAAAAPRNRTDHEIEVLRHVVKSSTDWVAKGQEGIIDGQVTAVNQKMAEAIIITARVKQMDPTGFLEACGARAMGLTVDGSGQLGEGGAAMAVAYLLNNLEPDEAKSLSEGNDVTDRAIVRAKNTAAAEAATEFDGHLGNKVKRWEESHDKALFDADALGRPYRRRSVRELDDGWQHSPAILNAPDVKASKAILGSN